MPPFFADRWYRWTSYLVLLVYWAALFAGTHAPNTPTSLPTRYIDKVEHAGAYLILVVLLANLVATYRRLTLRAVAACALVAVAFGAIDEVTQLLVPGRSAELADWLADLFGATLGAGIALGIARWLVRTPHRLSQTTAE